MSTELTTQISRDVTEIILESISDGVVTVGRKWRITSFNRAAENITGIPRHEAIGKHCWEVFRSNRCESDCALRRTMKQGKFFVDTSTYIVNRRQRRVPLVVVTSLLKNEYDTVVGGVETFRDMNQVEQLCKELLARAPHYLSPRRNKPFVAINCGAVSQLQAALPQAHGIRVLPDVAGRAEAALSAFLEGPLVTAISGNDHHMSGKKP